MRGVASASDMMFFLEVEALGWWDEGVVGGCDGGFVEG